MAFLRTLAGAAAIALSVAADAANNTGGKSR